MRFHLPLLALLALAGCHESMASRSDYIPPDPVTAATPDPFEPAAECDNPDCVCSNCDCAPCQCGVDNPDPVPQSASPTAAGPTLSLLTADWCPTCPAAKSAAYNASVAVELVDIDQHPERARELWSALRQERTVPMWVACVDGQPVKYWTGPSNAAGVEIMAAYVPPAQSASTGDYRLKRGDGSPVQDNGLVLPDGSVIMPDAPGYPEDYAPPYNAAPQRQRQAYQQPQYYYAPPQLAYQYYGGGCQGGQCYSGGCSGGGCR